MYTYVSLVLNRTCQVPSAKLRLMARWKGELTGFQNRYRWPRESTRSMNASRFNPGTASKRWLREVGCARMDTVRPVPLQWRVALVPAVDPGLGARVLRTLSCAARDNVGFQPHFGPASTGATQP